MSEARENYDKYTRHMVDKESTIGKYISELEQKNNTLEQYLRIEKEVCDETIKELEQQKAELCENIINKILAIPNLKSEYCQSSIIIIRNVLDDLGYKTDKPKYKQQEERDE